MSLLVDSHVLKWYAEDSSLVSDKAIEALEYPEAIVYVSAASLWELAIKAGKGKVQIDGGIEALFLRAVTAGWRLLPVGADEAMLAGRLPLHHTDPFDRLIVAQSLTYDYPLVSVDAILDNYGINRIW